MKKSLLFFVIVTAGTLSLILSGCFQTQSTTISYQTYIQTTPFSSVNHIEIFIKSINANGNTVLLSSIYNREYDLVPPLNGTGNFYIARPIDGLQGLSINGNPPFIINSLLINIGPVATIVLGNGNEYTVPVSTSVSVPFYSYSLQKMQVAPLQINNGQNKAALILWNLSNLSTSATAPITLSAIGLDMSQVVPLYITHGISSDPGLYGGFYRYASVSDFSKTYTFTSQGYWNTLNDTYDFTLYPFVAPTSQGYKATISINSATQTIVSSSVTINSSTLSLNL
ncbi:hypothetical protein [Athalassotoga saccharophila]|uniref:hypothetical protein n=1 Tax=Athalassotoga saccharophila TaxID=1441386 RepID=UPI00137AE905|nr:hypothetical protein [Athalassotoga saccharophila]BBJ27914.1 hypothetical protein ATHSA_0808 [Athalassotoga saccharophila]